MPALLHELAARAATTATSDDPTYPIYASAILLATASLILMLLILPPMIWHFHNSNIGATSLVAWTAMLLLFNFINAILWSDDNVDHWYNGTGLCDFEVKIQIASEVGRAASLACILRALATVLDTSRASLIETRSQTRRRYIIDLTCCLGLPLLQMLFHYIDQTERYRIYGIGGCQPATGNNLVSLFLIALPPLIWTMANAYYAILILVRLYRYRSSFSTILANNNTTKSRFMRLYVICVIWICGYIPVECYIFYFNFNNSKLPSFSWSEIHDPERWNEIIMVPGRGNVAFDRWIWLSCGFVVFVFFGLGRDAINMYRKNLLALGLGRVFPNLKNEYRGSITEAIGSYGSKARMMFNRKSTVSDSTSKSASDASHTSTFPDPASPHKEKHIESGDHSSSSVCKTHGDTRKSATGTIKIGFKPSNLSRLLGTLRRKTPAEPSQGDHLPLSNLSGEHLFVQSTVTSGPRSPTLSEHARSISSEEVLMRREIRQGSEHEWPKT